MKTTRGSSQERLIQVESREKCNLCNILAERRIRQRLPPNAPITNTAAEMISAGFSEARKHLNHTGNPELVPPENPEYEDGKENNCLRRWFRSAKKWVSGSKKAPTGQWVVQATRRSSIE